MDWKRGVEAAQKPSGPDACRFVSLNGRENYFASSATRPRRRRHFGSISMSPPRKEKKKQEDR